MTYYNTTAMDTATHLGSYLTAVNNLLNGRFFVMLTLFFGLMLLMVFMAREWSFADSMLTSGFVLSVISMFLMAGNLIGFDLLIIPLGIVAAGIVAKIL